MLDATLLAEIGAGDDIFWAGNCPPLGRLNTSHRLFDPTHDFRQPPSDHGRFSAVYLVEKDLGQHKQWPLILDEALRLLRYGQRSKLFLRFTQNPLLSIFALAAFLRRRRDFSFELIHQDSHPNGTIVYALNCQREELIPTLSTFEFALISDGQRTHNVVRFIDSVRQIRGINQIAWSVALCGPRSLWDDLSVATSLDNVRFVEEPDQHLGKPWITRKKNLIVESSTAENLLVAHDRYEMPAAFLDQMFEFGADFSVIAPAQANLAGQRFPDWVALSSQWSLTPCNLLQYGDYSPHLYVNGGVIISKRRVLTDTPWNNLLFWSQAEDVELSRSLTDKGITPRLAQKVELRVTDSRPGYRFDFTRLPHLPHAYAAATPNATDPCMAVTSKVQLDVLINLRDRSPQQLHDLGIVAEGNAWLNGAAGWIPLRPQAELSINLTPRSNTHISVRAYFPLSVNNADICISANDAPLTLHWRLTNEMQCATASLDALPPSAHQVTLAVTAPQATALMAIGLIRQGPEGLNHLPVDLRRYPVSLSHNARILGSGWSPPEAFGAWTCGNESKLQLPLEPAMLGRNLKLSLSMVAYGPPKSRRQWVGVAVEGMALALLEVRPHKKPVRRSIRIPRALVKNSSFLHVSLSPHAPVSPAELGQSSDTRRLGIGLTAVDLKTCW